MKKYQFTSKANSLCARFVDAFNDAKIDLNKITTWNLYKDAMVKAGKNLSGGKGKAYKDFVGKIAFPLFAEYLLNCELFTSTLGVHNMVSEWDLPGADHGVDGTCHLANDDNTLCTLQLKFKDNPTQFLDRNNDSAGNFYESSVEDYRITNRKNMIWFTNALGLNKNMAEYKNMVDGHRIAKLTDKKRKIFWGPFFDAIRAAEKTARIQRPQFGVTDKIYGPCQNRIFDAVNGEDYDIRIIDSGCGSGKGDAIGFKTELAFKNSPGSICAVDAARLQLLGELSRRIHTYFSSQPYTEATFSSRKDWDKETIHVGQNANKKIFASTNKEKWVDFFRDEVLPNTSQNLIIWVCYTSYEKFALMLKHVQDSAPDIWDGIKGRFNVELRDEVHNLTSIDKIIENPDEDRRLKRIVETHIPYMNTVFKQNVGFSATITNFIRNHPEIYGEVAVTVNQKEMQEQGVTIPLIPVVFTSDNEKLNTELTEDDKDLTYFIRAIDNEVRECEKTGLVPKVIIWSKSAVITGFFEAELRTYYQNSLVGSMTAATPYKQRDSFFTQFCASSELSILINYDIVSEGTDIDGASAVIVGRGLGNIKLVQIAGRPVRLHQHDRAALREGKIVPLDETGWIKPAGRLYLSEEADNLRNTNYTSDTIGYLRTLNEGGVINIADTKFMTKPKGSAPPSEPDGMDEADLPDPEFQQLFYDTLQMREYRTSYPKMTIDELMSGI